MVQAGGGFYLAEESLTPERGGELGFQHLDRNFAMVLLVLGEKDNSHPAPAEFAIDRVAVSEDTSQAGQQIRHGRLRLNGTKL